MNQFTTSAEISELEYLEPRTQNILNARGMRYPPTVRYYYSCLVDMINTDAYHRFIDPDYEEVYN